MKKLSYPALTRAQYLGVCYALFAGDSCRMAGNAQGLTDSTVKAIRRQSGLDYPSFPHPEKTGTKLLCTVEVENLLSLRAGGIGVKHAAELAEVSSATVYYIEDITFNVVDKNCTTTHGRKLARAESWASTCGECWTYAIACMAAVEPNTRKVARSLGMCEYRVKAVLASCAV